MADLTVSADIDTFMGAANFAAARTALGVPGLAGNTFTGAQVLPFGTVAAPSLAVGHAGTGLFSPSSTYVSATTNGVEVWCINNVTGGFRILGSLVLGWTSGSPSGTLSDVGLARLGAANLRLGLAPSATPIAQTLTIGEASRPGTDSNVAGASGTIASGLGTGTGTQSTLAFLTPTTVASGSGVQTYVQRLGLGPFWAQFSVGIQVPDTNVFAWSTRARFASPADGIITLNNNANSDFTRLQFGGTTSAFPALRRDSAQLTCVFADDSNFANFRAKQLIADSLSLTTAAAPSSATASGATGTVIHDGNHIYVCTATNVWKRAALATW